MDESTILLLWRKRFFKPFDSIGNIVHSLNPIESTICMRFKLDRNGIEGQLARFTFNEFVRDTLKTSLFFKPQMVF